MYVVVEHVYEMKDMIDFDGEHVEAWIDRDMRRRAAEAGYTVNASEMDEVDLRWDEKFQMRIILNVRADGVSVYKVALQSPRQLTRADGHITPRQ